MDEYFNDEEVDHVSCCIGFNKWKSVRITAFPAEIFVTIIKQNNEIEKVRKAIRVDPLINLGKYTDLNIDVIYRFKAAIIHHGRSTKSGHYVAIRRVGVYDIQIDDLHFGFNRDNSLSTDGYILLYEQIPIEKAYCPLLPNAMICLRETKAMSILVEEGMSNQTYSSRKQQILKLTEQLKVTKTQVIQSNIMYKLLDGGLKSLFLEGYDQFPNDMLCSIILYLFGTNPVTVKENFGITYVKVSSCSKCQHLTKKECHDIVFDEVAIKMSEKICRMCGHEPMGINIVVTNVGQTLLFRYNVTLIDDNGIDELLASLTFILPIERLHYQPKSILSADTAVNLRMSDNGVRTTNLFIDSQQKVVEMNMDELIQKIPIEKSIVMADKRIARFRKQYKIISRDSEFSQLNEVSLELDKSSQRFVERFRDKVSVEKLALTETDVERFLHNEFNDINIDSFLEVLKQQNATAENCVFEPAGLYGSRLAISDTNYYTGNADWFAKSLIIIPVNIENVHWILVAIDMKELSIYYMDPLGHTLEKSIIDRIYSYLAFKSVMDTNTVMANDWSVKDLTQTEMFPKQTDKTSCGAMICLYAKMIVQNVRVTKPSTITVRKFILHEILSTYYKNISSDDFGLKYVLQTQDIDKLVLDVMTGRRDITGQHKHFLKNPVALHDLKLAGFGLKFLCEKEYHAIQTYLLRTFTKYIHKVGRVREQQSIFDEAVELNNLLRQNVCYAQWYIDNVLVKEVLVELLSRFKQIDRKETHQACKKTEYSVYETMRKELKKIREKKKADVNKLH